MVLPDQRTLILFVLYITLYSELLLIIVCLSVEYICPNCHHLNVPKGRAIVGQLSPQAVLREDSDEPLDTNVVAVPSSASTLPILSSTKVNDGDSTPKQRGKKGVKRRSVRRKAQTDGDDAAANYCGDQVFSD